jgi:hypothetical protein
MLRQQSKVSQDGSGHRQQVINIIYTLKDNWCNKITKETRGKDGEPREP